MHGFITRWDVLFRPLTIIGAFGTRVSGRCLRRLIAGHGEATFLECIYLEDP